MPFENERWKSENEIREKRKQREKFENFKLRLALVVGVFAAASMVQKWNNDADVPELPEPPRAEGPVTPGPEPKKEPLKTSPNKNIEKKEDPVIRKLLATKAILEDAARKQERLRIFKDGTPDMERCRDTEAILKNPERIIDLGTLGLFIAQNVQHLHNPELQAGLERHLKKHFGMSAAEVGMRKNEARARLSQKAQKAQWWISGCSGFVAHQAFDGRNAEFAGAYAKFFAELIDAVIEGSKAELPDSRDAPAALERIITDLLKPAR